MPSNFSPFGPRASRVSVSSVSSGMIGSASIVPFPTTPGHAAL
jgi:hypothetical protein